MSYYFPFGGISSLQNISYSLSTTTASVPFSNTIFALESLYAPITEITPLVGQNGTSVTFEQCTISASLNPSLLTSGSTGLPGLTGSLGNSNTSCPVGSIRCNNLQVSLSAAYNDGVWRGVNYYVPSGSQYSIVCMQIPPGCAATATCPPYLPMGTWPSIP